MTEKKQNFLLVSAFIGFGVLVFFGITTIVKADTCASFTETANDDFGFGRIDGTIEQVAQPFTVASDCEAVTEISVVMYTTGSPSDDVTIGIWSDTTGSPGSLIEQCANLNVVGGTPTEYFSTCGGTTNLTAGTTYLIFADRTGADWNTN